MWRWLFNQLGLILTALAFAIIVWAVATSEESPGHEGVFPEALTIEVTSPTGLIVSQKSAESVRVRVRAPQANWDELQRSSFHASLDLKAYGVGTFDVPVQVSATDPRVVILSIDPPAVNIKLEPAKSRFIDARAEVLDSAPLGYTFRPPVLTSAQITVSGPASLVDQVVDVTAEVFLRGARSPIEREAALVARDAQGKEIKDLTISPATVIVKIPVEQRVGFKDVSVKTILRGNVAPGYWISNIIVIPSSATVVGNADALAKISGFVETSPIDVSNATFDVTTNAALNLPEGVSILDNQTISIRVSVTPILGGQTVRRQVKVQNLRAGLFATLSPEQVDLILAGPLPSLQNLSVDTAAVIVDAANLGPGVYPLKPLVTSVIDPLKVQSIVPDTIQLIITEGTPTPSK